jgi:tetraacyldisaccharide 4'-kinase
VADSAIPTTEARRGPERILRRAWEGERVSPALRASLWGLSVAYGAFLRVRESLYGMRLLHAGRLPCPVISVGNITLGGSGKTPLAELAVRTLLGLGARPAVVSRGYGRRTRGVHVVADRSGIRLPASAAGDEPRLLAEHLPGVPVVVGESRYEAAARAIEAGADAIVIDDGFQHRTVDKSLEILAVSADAPWGNGRLFPRGVLREPLAALRRAHVVVVTEAERPGQVEEVRRTLARQRADALCLSARYEVLGARETTSGREVPATELAGRSLLAFAGLASPRRFAETLGRLGAVVTELVEFPDHHWYAPPDLLDLTARGSRRGTEGLITTEKDWMRLQELPRPPLPLWVLRVRLTLAGDDGPWRDRLGAAWHGARLEAG